MEKTGVIYFNQVGGTACLSEEAEGYLCPVNHEENFRLDTWLSQIFLRVNRPDLRMADQIDGELKKYVQTSFISVDRHRLNDSCESWLHVVIDLKNNELIEGASHSNAILTWPNSD
ncbi:DUF6210 family protein [Microbulbifer sp. 2201CG32-9]|uniref:DUF6210 family protein n=1 Tax=Microbulbifer sp. 2201CG32-9 TaxID=3232309 RepID=UPI00345BA1C7